MTHADRPRHRTLALLAALLSLAGCGADEEPGFALEPLPFGDGELHLSWSAGALAFSAADIRLAYRTEDRETVIYEGQIANDGATLGWGNLQPVTSRYPELLLCLNGAEQDDVSLRINVEARTVAQMARACRE